MNGLPIGPTRADAAPAVAPALAGQVFAFVLAGGRGTRLGALTDRRAKPALPMAGTLRVIDFAIGNCLNAGIRDIAVLLQYRAASLLPHLAACRSDPRAAGLAVVAGPRQAGCTVYRGTADAVHRNLRLARARGARFVMVLAGDQVYRMDPGAMLAEHVRRGAVATVACLEVPRADAHRFGVVTADADGRVTGFVEKPLDPPPRAGRAGVSLASMGLYLFDADRLAELLERDARDPDSGHDFGYDVLPALVRAGLLHAHDFADSAVRGVDGTTYWRDVGTVESYWSAQMDFVRGDAGFDPADPRWPIGGAGDARRGRWIDPGEAPYGRRPRRSIVAPGCTLGAARVVGSIVGTDTFIGPGCDVQDSVLLPGVTLGPRVALRRTIVDEGCRVPAGLRAGFDAALDAERFHVDAHGITVITRAMLQRLWESTSMPAPTGARQVDRGLAAA